MLSTFSNAIRENVEIRSEKMYRQVWYGQPYLRFCNFANRMPAEGGVKEVAPKGDLLDSKQVTPTDDPIQVWEDFSGKNGGTSMMIPVKMTIKPRPILGDDTLTLKGARNTFVYKNLRINQVRQAVNTKAGAFNEQIIKKYVSDLMNQAQPQLTDWFRRYINTSMIKRGLLEGRSYELTASTPFGRGLAKISHPNFYVTGNGWVTYSGGKPGSAGYESAVATALDTLGAGDVISLGLLRTIGNQLARQKRILPSVVTSFGEYYICIITPAQKQQLEQDPLWLDIVKQVLPREKDERMNWLLSGRTGVFGNLLFYTDILGWGAHTNANANGWATAPTAGTVGYGAEDLGTGDFQDIGDLDDSNFQIATILGGGGALNVGIAKRLGFTAEELDHANIKEVGANMMCGAERGDLFDSDAQIAGNSAGDFVENTSSMVLATYSPAIS